jgi:hypothetical protein
MMFYAIQENTYGTIQWVGAAGSPLAALAALAGEVGVRVASLDQEDFIISCLREDEYDRLKECDGHDQKAIDFFESCDRVSWAEPAIDFAQNAQGSVAR